ncbi:MAG: hypothetical protein ACYC3I_05515 [Gemmataceae bacterium]
MPIRFRCHQCNQLMGIARRKAGTTVRCPTCRAALVVPQPGEEAKPEPYLPPAPSPPVGGPAPPLFEHSDFEDFLKNPVANKPVAPAPPPSPPPLAPFATDIPPAPLFTTPSATPRAHPLGLVLSPTQATWLTVAVILMVAAAFAAGLLVGYYLLGR